MRFHRNRTKVSFSFGGGLFETASKLFQVIVKEVLRVAYFPDSFLEVNGVAMTSNKLVRFVRKRGYPFLVVHAAPKTEK